jgi:two-component system phosphate regulon response regulator PhoB
MNNTILICETDKVILEIVTFILSEQGFIIKPLLSEQSVVQTILDIRPCAILLDVVRMTQEGTHLCRQIKNTKRMMHIPLIVLSTQAKAMTLKGRYADEVLMKPFDIYELIAVVEKASRKPKLPQPFVHLM